MRSESKEPKSRMEIDNFDIVKTLMPLQESDRQFMHLQILRRGKDHPELPAANKLMKSWLVRSGEHLDSLKEEVMFLCEHYTARAYISCAPKSIAKLNTLILLKLADNLHTGNVVNPWHVFNSACGELPGVEKRWVVYVDSINPFDLTLIENEINIAWVKAHPQDAGKREGETWRICRVPTLNGHHLIVRPFDLRMFHEVFPEVEVKKNGLTALYVPQCICEKL